MHTALWVWGHIWVCFKLPPSISSEWHWIPGISDYRADDRSWEERFKGNLTKTANWKLQHFIFLSI